MCIIEFINIYTLLETSARNHLIESLSFSSVSWKFELLGGGWQRVGLVSPRSREARLVSRSWPLGGSRGKQTKALNINSEKYSKNWSRGHLKTSVFSLFLFIPPQDWSKTNQLNTPGVGEILTECWE